MEFVFMCYVLLFSFYVTRLSLSDSRIRPAGLTMQTSEVRLPICLLRQPAQCRLYLGIAGSSGSICFYWIAGSICFNRIGLWVVRVEIKIIVMICILFFLYLSLFTIFSKVICLRQIPTLLPKLCLL